ncbi:hypothetical protein AB0953_16495 [Streptomyces sp. NPDC046866]|uniref:hypothetical protein n=1 Tax=Streptomyces sp. NPDC046866 TaxID=3154921 RepID=UPI003456801D
MSETSAELSASESGAQIAPVGEPEAEADAPLGPAGEKALDLWKQRAKEAEKASREQAKRLQALEDRDKTEVQRASERAEAAEKRAAAMVQRTVRAEVRALAAATFADPSDAAAFLDPSEFVDDDGDVDTKAVEKALADLLKRKPHLAKEAAPPSFDGGARRTADKPPSMNDLIRQKAGLG